MPVDRLKVAALQMVSGDDVGANLRSAENLLRRAADSGAQLAVLPECFSLMAGAEKLRSAAVREANTAVIQSALAQWASQLKIAIVGGTVGIDDGNGKARAAVHLFSADGERLARYDKMHLFDADVGDAQGSYRESDNYAAGNSVIIADVSGVSVGLAVCYDLRFPEMLRVMQERGVDMIAVPAAFTRRTGLAHWLPLLRARAIENQCVVIGANQGGAHGSKRLTSGGSVIVDGWGEVLGEAGFGECCVIADVDLVQQRRWRAAMPVANHRRIKTLLPGDESQA